MSINSLRMPSRPVGRRPIKSERPKKIPVVPKQEAEDPADYKEYSLVACKDEDIENMRTNVLKFQSKHKINPSESFTKPVRLHRKETRNLQYQLTRAEIEQRQRENAEARRIAEEERLAREKAKAEEPGRVVFDIKNDPNVAPEPEPEPKTEEEKRIEKMAKQQANIAPDGGARKKLFKDNRKTRQVRVMKEEDRKLRYEEFYPWVMEDWDGQNTWVGQYEAANADTYCLLVLKDDKFTMIPVDKVYKFTPRNKYATLTLEEAEARMEKHNTVPRWLMKHLDEKEQKLTRYERTKKKLKTVEGTSENDNGKRDSDNDDLDFDEEFADDEEAPIIDGNEEENKESERKMKREMLGANAMGLHDQDGEEEDDVDDLFEARKVDKDGERVRKTLMKTEGTGIYDSEDEVNPYLNESDLEIDNSEEEIIAADLGKSVSPAGSSVQTRQSSPAPGTRIKVKSINSPIGFVVLKGLPSVLMQFPRGEWNPNAKRRVPEYTGSDDESRYTKRIKLEDDDHSIPTTVKSEEPIQIPTVQASNGDLLTAEDVLSVVRNAENITVKDLIIKLKSKLKNPENRSRIKLLVNQLLKTENGFLVPKETTKVET